MRKLGQRRLSTLRIDKSLAMLLGFDASCTRELRTNATGWVFVRRCDLVVCGGDLPNENHLSI
jgi:hypothetical protein